MKEKIERLKLFKNNLIKINEEISKRDDECRVGLISEIFDNNYDDYERYYWFGIGEENKNDVIIRFSPYILQCFETVVVAIDNWGRSTGNFVNADKYVGMSLKVIINRILEEIDEFISNLELEIKNADEFDSDFDYDFTLDLDTDIGRELEIQILEEHKICISSSSFETDYDFRNEPDEIEFTREKKSCPTNNNLTNNEEDSNDTDW